LPGTDAGGGGSGNGVWPQPGLIRPPQKSPNTAAKAPAKQLGFIERKIASHPHKRTPRGRATNFA